jgi:hypothetical protein
MAGNVDMYRKLNFAIDFTCFSVSLRHGGNRDLEPELVVHALPEGLGVLGREKRFRASTPKRRVLQEGIEIALEDLPGLVSLDELLESVPPKVP